MEDVNKLKYLQNPHLLQALVDTGDRVIHEATTGPTWGINASIRSKAAKESSGTGQNLLGQILVKLRTEFKLLSNSSDTPTENESL